MRHNTLSFSDTSELFDEEDGPGGRSFEDENGSWDPEDGYSWNDRDDGQDDE